MVPIDLIHGASGLLHKNPAHICFLGRAILPLQRRFDGSILFHAQLP